ncbi:hypothetical protein HK104_005494 [Borealophlyctis nickersoniae]|nr:hypothetical protein HK104_005494 [Borealophlyctis nickersoniae]
MQRTLIPLGHTPPHEIQTIPTNNPTTFRIPSYLEIGSPITLEARYLADPENGPTSLFAHQVQMINAIALQTMLNSDVDFTPLMVQGAKEDGESESSRGKGTKTRSNKGKKAKNGSSAIKYDDWPEEGFTDLAISLLPPDFPA